MQLMIRNNTAAPIYQQIYQQIKEQIINGTLEEDTMLPSIRISKADLQEMLNMIYEEDASCNTLSK